MICLKWHFGEVEYEGKKIIWGIFKIEIPNQKGRDFL
jgi:hypothetical protein